MNRYIIITSIGVLAIVIMFITEKYNIKYKGQCIKHDWEYKFEFRDYWRYTGSFLRENERYECKKCGKIEKK